MKEAKYKQLEYPSMKYRKVFGMIYLLLLFLMFLQAIAIGMNLLRFFVYFLSFGGLLGFFLLLEYKVKHQDYYLCVDEEKIVIERAVFPTLTIFYKYIVDIELVGKKSEFYTRHIHFRYQTEKDDFPSGRKLYEVYGFDLEEFYFELKQHLKNKEE